MFRRFFHRPSNSHRSRKRRIRRDRRMASRRDTLRHAHMETLEDRLALSSLLYVDNVPDPTIGVDNMAGDYLVTTDANSNGVLDANDIVTWRPGQPEGGPNLQF